MEKKGTLASPATAFASSVLPVPGGPTRMMPLGIFAPTFVNFSGALRNSTISFTSVSASSSPATSSNVVRLASFSISLALDLPKLKMELPPPPSPDILPDIMFQKKKSRAKGINQVISSGNNLLDCA